MAKYQKPPIFEAIIEFRTADAVPDNLVDKAAASIKKRYARAQELHEFKVKLGAGKAPETDRIGYKLASETGEFIAQPRRQGLAFSSLAPYPGWTAFTAEFFEIWKRWKKAVGPHRVGRIGIRFQNRIDVPIGETERIDSDDYLRIGIRLPESSGNFADTWQVAAVSPVKGTPFMVIMKAGTADRALFGHVSYNLDLDLYCDVDVPQSDDDIVNLLAQAKLAKNQVFEECITDKSRALLA
ncbi:MAG: TIGR04255 family protein [Caulobacter sp.]|nr:TIGR04255 family protein [Caulobacter sp.]